MRILDYGYLADSRRLARHRIRTLGLQSLPRQKYRSLTWRFMKRQRLVARLWREFFTPNEVTQIFVDEVMK